MSAENINFKYKTSPLVMMLFRKRTSIYIKGKKLFIKKGKEITKINIENIEILPKVNNVNFAHDTIIIKANHEISFSEASYRRQMFNKNVVDIVTHKYVKIYEKKLKNIIPIQKKIYNIIKSKYPTDEVINNILQETNKALSTFNECWDQEAFQDNLLSPYKYLVNLHANHKSIFNRIKTKFKITEKLNMLIKPKALEIEKKLHGIFPRDSLIKDLTKKTSLTLNQFSNETDNQIGDFENEIESELISKYKYLKNLMDDKTFFNNIRDSYIKRKKEENELFFSGLEPKLNNEQIKACIVDNDNNLIIAGAGTGKTSTMIAKGAYLVKNKICFPHEILMVVFNHNARKTLIERNKKFNYCKEIKIHTFHSLGRSIAATVYKDDGKKISNEMKLLSENIIKGYIKKWMQELMEDKDYARKFIDYILWEQCTAKTKFDFENPGEYYRYVDINKLYSVKKIEINEDLNSDARQMQESEKDNKITYKREKVRSKGEWIIVNYLFVNNVKYYYEYQDQERKEIKDHEKENGLNKKDMPSIYLPDYKIYIEYFHLDINGEVPPSIDQTEYENYINKRRKAFEQDDCKGKLIECYHYELQKNQLLDNLQNKLLESNVVLNRLSDGDLLCKLKEYREYERLSDYLFKLISVAKGACETDEEIYELARKSKYKSHVLKVLDLMMPLKEKYEDYLKNYGFYYIYVLVIAPNKIVI